jgi:hypothetical protein
MAWQCIQAKMIWKVVLKPWERILGRPITWEDVVQASSVKLPRMYSYRAQKSIRYAWTITRGCVLHTLWTDRNERWSSPEIPPVSRVALLATIGRKIQLHWDSVHLSLKKGERNAWTFIGEKFPNLRQAHLVEGTDAGLVEDPDDLLEPERRDSDRVDGGVTIVRRERVEEVMA